MAAFAVVAEFGDGVYGIWDRRDPWRYFRAISAPSETTGLMFLETFLPRRRSEW